MKLLLFFSVVILFAGCATIPQGTTPSSSPLISVDGKAKTYEVLGNSEGSAGHFTLFGFIPFGRTDIDEAIQDALTPYKGDNLINVHYYVNSAFYFIGNSTSITVKGDVIRYIDKTKLADLDTKARDYNIPIKPSSNLNHRLTFGSAIGGLSADYTLIKPLNDFLFFSFSLGYKHYENNERITENFGGFFYTWNFDSDYEAVPISFNIGGNARKFIKDIPINPYASIGVAYVPLDFEQWDQVGLNFNIGAEYEFLKGIAVGLDYRYIKSFIDFRDEGKGISFSNLNLSLVFYP